MSNNSAPTRSKTSLTTRALPLSRGCSTCSIGSPSTGRIVVRSPATSTRVLATIRSISSCSSCHASWRSAAPSISGQDNTTTVSASELLDRRRDLVEGAVDGRQPGREAVAAQAGWQAGADDAEAVVAFVAEPAGHVGDGALVAHQDDPLQPLAAGPGTVQQLSDHISGAEVDDGGQWHRDDDVSARKTQIEREGNNCQTGGQPDAGSEYPSVLVGADEQVARLVRSVDGQPGDPGNRQ